MQTSDFERFRAVMVGMGKVYEREIDAPLLDAYWLSLRDWSLEDFEAAAGHLMRESRYMPRPAEFSALRKASEVTAGEAWELVLRGQAEPGSRAARAAEIVTSAYGRRLGMLHLERELPHAQRRFFDVYAELSDVDEARAAVPQIAHAGSTLRLRTGGPVPVGQVMTKAIAK